MSLLQQRPSRSISNPFGPSELPEIFRNCIDTLVFRSSDSCLTAEPILLRLSPSEEDMLSEMIVQLFFRVRKSFFAPAAGMSLEERFKWMMVSFILKALHRIYTPLLDKEFFDRLICVNLVFFFNIFVSTTAAFGPNYYSYSTNFPFLQVVLILSINFAAYAGRY